MTKKTNYLGIVLIIIILFFLVKRFYYSDDNSGNSGNSGNTDDSDITPEYHNDSKNVTFKPYGNLLGVDGMYVESYDSSGVVYTNTFYDPDTNLTSGSVAVLDNGGVTINVLMKNGLKYTKNIKYDNISSSTINVSINYGLIVTI